ncbi:unnamed protein product [Cyprideis torosa]|uniref:Uncharacterized protein n=1 Tax=Cyprideis torosa TaxID=163714 RepID=A0A7R8W643_9CRUS|nr:unnamed protein product [Cyprideis torosa]CAG0883614.1 unnamed protein product [Cyprideis torosa]
MSTLIETSRPQLKIASYFFHPHSGYESQKSTKGASKLRRDLINAEINALRELLPIPPTARQRLSQLQLMALVCVYVRKCSYFFHTFKALSGFLMILTQTGKLIYISDNAAEYLGHSMEDLLIHGDSFYDIIDKQDHSVVQSELLRSSVAASQPHLPGSRSPVPVAHPHATDDERLFLCRMNVSRNARRQMRFGDQKVVLVRGRYYGYLPLCSRNEPVFLASCTPLALPETRESVAHGATNVFTSTHRMDMKFISIDNNAEFHLGYPKSTFQGLSWYYLLHPDQLREAQNKHKSLTQSEQERSCIMLLRYQTRYGNWIWVHCVMQVKENVEGSQDPIVVITNQVLRSKEATVMKNNSWLYHYYSVQNKMQYGFTYGGQSSISSGPGTPSSLGATTPTQIRSQPPLLSSPSSHRDVLPPSPGSTYAPTTGPLPLPGGVNGQHSPMAYPSPRTLASTYDLSSQYESAYAKPIVPIYPSPGSTGEYPHLHSYGPSPLTYRMHADPYAEPSMLTGTEYPTYSGHEDPSHGHSIGTSQDPAPKANSSRRPPTLTSVIRYTSSTVDYREDQHSKSKRRKSSGTAVDPGEGSYWRDPSAGGTPFRRAYAEKTSSTITSASPPEQLHPREEDRYGGAHIQGHRPPGTWDTLFPWSRQTPPNWNTPYTPPQPSESDLRGSSVPRRRLPRGGTQ